jgi:hypothetical protein
MFLLLCKKNRVKDRMLLYKHQTDLNKEEIEEGQHEIEFDASNLSSGVYFYRLSVGSLSGQVVEEGKNVFTETKKFLQMK